MGSVRERLLRIGTDGLALEVRLMLLLEGVDVRQKRIDEILLLLLISGHSRLSREVMLGLSTIGLKRSSSGWNLMRWAIVCRKTHHMRMNTSRRANCHLVQKRLV